MSLQTQIKEDMVAAMKARNTEVVSLLRVVAGEFGRVGKELSDEEALKVLRKMSENATELGNQGEVDILDKYLPKMLGELQIKTIVGGIISANKFTGMPDMGKAMGIIKNHPMSAQIDGKIASQIARELLTK